MLTVVIVRLTSFSMCIKRWIIGFLTFASIGFSSGWLRFYGGVEREYGASIQALDDSSLVIAGGSGSFGGAWLVKIDQYGDSVWSRVWEGGSACVSTASDGGFIVSGDITPPHEWKEVLLIKTDDQGRLQWQNTFGGDNQDRGNCVVEVEDGFVICGYKSFLTLPGPELYLVKTDFLGGLIWEKTYVQDSFSSANFIDKTADGGFIVTGYSGWFGDTVRDQNLWLLKTDGNGDTLWTRTFGLIDCYDHGECVRQTPDGGYIICGWTESYGDPNGDLWLIRADQYGDSLWSKVYGGSLIDAGASVQLVSDGFIVAGLRSSSSADGNLWLLRTDEFGDTLWTREFGGDDWDRGYSVTVCSDGGFAATGITRSFGSGNFDLLALKVDSSGNLPRVVAPTSILVPSPDSLIPDMFPEARFTNVSNQSYSQDFGVYCTITCLDSAETFLPVYFDSVWINSSLEPWGSIDAQFSLWTSFTGEFEVSFYASGQDFTSPLLSTTFYWTGVHEQPAINISPTWSVVQSTGRVIVISNLNPSGQNEIQVYDACGRKVDRISLTSQSRHIHWGGVANSGIYFLVEANQSTGYVQKVVIIK